MIGSHAAACSRQSGLRQAEKRYLHLLFRSGGDLDGWVLKFNKASNSLLVRLENLLTAVHHNEQQMEERREALRS